MAVKKSWVSLVCEVGTLDSVIVVPGVCTSRRVGLWVAASTGWYIPCSCSNGNISRDDVPS